MNLKLSDLAGPAGMALFIVAVQVLSLLLVGPLESSDFKAFENPESLLNPIIYIVILLVFTAVLLLIIKYKLTWMIQAFIGFAVFSTLVYVLYGVGALLFPGLTWEVLMIAAALVSVLLSALMLLYPEWYVVDTVGIMTAAGASALFGISLSVLPVILLLVVLAIYDFISVYKTKHMITLAEGVMDLKLPILFVLPRRPGYSYRHSDRRSLDQSGEREAYFMGLGDAVMPTILAVSANAFLTAPSIFFVNVPALGSIVGTLISYAALMYFVMKGKPQAGLPFLCTGAIIGFFIGCLAVGVNPFAGFRLF